MTTETPAAVLRAAAVLLRKAASHATPGPWRSHDTWLDSGGHTATVLTDRESINDTELVAWLPTMSNTPWDEARNAWRNAGWMALMDPGVGLALAELLGTAARFASLHADLFTASTGRAPTEADLDEATRAALVVARRILGTTEQADTETAPAEFGLRADTEIRAAVLREAADALDARAGVLEELSSSSFGEESYAARELTEAADRLHRLADEAQQPTPAGSTADKAAALGMDPTDYRRYSHDTAVEQIRIAGKGLYAETWLRVMDALEQQPTPAPAEETTR